MDPTERRRQFLRSSGKKVTHEEGEPLLGGEPKHSIDIFSVVLIAVQAALLVAISSAS
jgi:hypothetical protein